MLAPTGTPAMNEPQTRHVIQVGSRQAELPEGVTPAEWALERSQAQNPRIRAYLGCLRLLEGVLESNYAILHCSPDRLREMWHRVRQVSDLIRKDLAPLLEPPSKIPALEEARQNAGLALKVLGSEVLTSVERLPEKPPPDRLLEVRKLLCVATGQLQAFLQDTFGQIMAADPRSRHDADYFLSRRLPRDIDEAEWLQLTVDRLSTYVQGLEEQRPQLLSQLADALSAEPRLPTGRQWQDTVAFLIELTNGLAPRLKEALALRGVRFYEMEILDRYALDIPVQCRMLIELQEAAREALAQLEAGESGPGEGAADPLAPVLHAAFARRMVRWMTTIDRSLKDLAAFVPLWLQGIERRRALLLKRTADEAGSQRASDTRPVG